MRCTIYKSLKKTEAYLYVREGVEFESLPAALRAQFGRAEEVMKLELHEGRKLAREDVVTVMANLSVGGFHLQMPSPELAPLRPRQ